MPTSYNALSTQVIYASKAGIPGGGYNIAGPDASAALQAILNTATSASPLWLILDINVSARDLKVLSNTKITQLPGNSCWQLPGGTCFIRNTNWVSSYNTNSAATGAAATADAFGSYNINGGNTIVDQNITLDGLYINGNRGSGGTTNASANLNGVASSDPRYVGNNGSDSGVYGQFICPIQFYGVKNVTLDNISIYDPAGYCIHFANAFKVYARNITVLDPVYAVTPVLGRNTAGFQFNGPCDDIRINGLTLTVGDDGIALNAGDYNTLAVNIPNLTGPQLFGSWSDVYNGPITNVLANMIHPNGSCNVIDIDGSNGLVLDNIIVTNVVGTTKFAGATFNSWGGAPAIGRVTLTDWTVDLASGAAGFVDLNTNVASLSINNFQRANVGGSPDCINVTAGTIGQIKVQGYHLTGSTVSNQGSVITVSGGTVGSISLANIYADSIPNVVNYTGGTVAELMTSNIRHRNATSGNTNTINVGTGMTLARLRSSGSNTVALVGTSAGTITSKKTDGTEDAS